MNWIRKVISRLNYFVKAILIMLPVIISIAFVEKRYEEKDCRRIVVKIENTLNNYFLEERDILNMVNGKGSQRLEGIPLNAIDMREIEKNVRRFNFVKSAQVYRDLKGNIIVSVIQQRPIARIVRANAPDAYICEGGEILPTVEKYSARSLILRGDYLNRLIEEGLTAKNQGNKLLEMLKFIDGDKYWKAQIAEIEFENNGNMVLFPQIGKQEFIFGKPDDYEEKFKKINIFYEKIRPLKGWNHYNRVNLKFKNQIVCE